MSSRDADREPWHLDKKVPIALIVTIALQTIGIVWYASKLDSRVAVVEQHVADTKEDASRLVRLESFRDNLRSRLDRLESKIDRLLEHGPSR